MKLKKLISKPEVKKPKVYKIKDLANDVSLLGIKVKIPKKYLDGYMGIKKEMRIFSQWNKGVWLKNDMNEGHMYPLTFDTDLKELLDFEIVPEKENA